MKRAIILLHIFRLQRKSAGIAKCLLVIISRRLIFLKTGKTQVNMNYDV